MKPPPFDYVAPTSLDEAVQRARRARRGRQGAGRGAEPHPAAVVAACPAHCPRRPERRRRAAASIAVNGDRPRIGAMTRHRAVERSASVAQPVPLLAAAVPYIGHVAIRTRGTIGGSLAHADPAAELPAVALALDATFAATSTRGTRTISAADFFVGYFTTDARARRDAHEGHVPATPLRAPVCRCRRWRAATATSRWSACRGIGRRRAATCASRSSTWPTGRSERPRPRPRCRARSADRRSCRGSPRATSTRRPTCTPAPHTAARSRRSWSGEH